MTNYLLLKNNYNSNEITQEQRVECFGLTLNEAFKQFQKLWHDYKELQKKCQEHETTSSHITHGVQNVTEVTDGSKNKRPISVELTNEQSDVPSLVKKTIEPDSLAVQLDSNEKFSKLGGHDDFQISSQDLWTQGLEESFHNPNESLLQERVNIAAKGSKSPILGSKKKSRVASRLAISPSVSENSVILLDNSIDGTGEKSNDVFAPNKTSDQDAIVSQTNPAQSTNRPILQPLPLNLPSTPKNTGKLCISTTHNVSIDLVGNKKKLKQTKLFLKKDKVTDLSDCNDIVMSRQLDQKSQTETSTANNYMDDSLIHPSPIHEKNPSKTRKKMTKKNKSAERLHEKSDLDEDTGMETSDVETPAMDTDATIFEPKVASTQYSHLFSFNKAPQAEQKFKKKGSFLGQLNNRKEEVKIPVDADIEMNDDTMYEANRIPTDDRSLKNLDVGKSSKKNNNLSLKKSVTVHRNFQTTPKHLMNAHDEELATSKEDISLDNCKELRDKTPTKKNPTAANFDKVPKKRAASPSYVYKENPVRKRDERAQLKGWSCFDCQKYYDGMDLSEAELQRRKDQCSRHRSKFNKNQLTQEGYWNPDFTSSWHSTVWEDD